MKKLLILILAIFAFAICYSAEIELSVEEQKGLENLITDNLEKEYDLIKSESLSELFDGVFIKVIVKHLYHSNNKIEEIVVANHNGEFSELSGVDKLVPLLKPSYTLTSIEDTEILADVFKKLFPGYFSSFDDGIYQKDNQWFFIYSEFFDDKDGIVVTVNEAGKVTKIETQGGIE